MPRVAGPLRRHLSRAAQPAPVAQLDRAPDYESGGQEFESLRARHHLAIFGRIIESHPIHQIQELLGSALWTHEINEIIDRLSLRLQECLTHENLPGMLKWYVAVLTDATTHQI